MPEPPPRARPAPPPVTSPAGRTDPRPGWMLIAFVGIALVSLVVVPLVVDRLNRPAYDELRGVAEPGRGLVTQLHVALAMQASALHDFVESRDEAHLVRYHQATAGERRAYEALVPLARRLGPGAAARLAELRDQEALWHGSVESYLRRVVAGEPVARDPLQGELYDELLLAAARLDQAFDEAAQSRRQRILEAERAERRVTATLGGVALLALVAVAWLGARLRAYADEAARGHREALDLMESRARLMRGVSHDLKNPLNALDGHAQLLEEELVGPLTPAQRRSVERIRRSVRALLGLIEDLLELHRAEAGQLALRMRPIDVREVVGELVEEFQAAARATGHQLALADGDALPPVVSDPDRVRQVLGNLLANALKHTPPGGRITVRLARRARSRQSGAPEGAAIDVADTGPGIPPERREEVFAEFARLAPAERPGAGLGLAIARRIARQLGGEITLESEPGLGACFTLWLPADAAAATGGQRPRPPT